MNLSLILLLAAGFLLIKFFQAKSGLKPQDAKRIVSEGGRVIDVRSIGEYKSGHFKSAINIPHTEILKGIKKAKLGKDSPLILYCASGARSAAAISTLKSEGYTQVYNGGTLRRITSLLS